MFKLLFSAALLITPTLLVAQIADPDSVPAVSSVIVVTASGVPEPVETTPASVTVITREAIEGRKEREIADLLREVPGLTVSRTGGPGKNTSLFTRGGESNYTLVLWNGIELNDPYFAGFNWGGFTTAGVDRVEVVRGPYSALWGSEAASGVINVVTGNRGNDIDLDLQAGEKGLFSGLVDGSLSLGAISLDAAVEHRTDDGFYDNDDHTRSSGHAGVTWAPGGNLRLGLLLRASEYEVGLPFNVNAAGDAFVPSPLRRMDGEETLIAIPLQHSVGRLSYDVTVSRIDREDNFADPEDPFGYIGANTESDSTRGTVTTRTATAFGTIVAGGEFEKVEVTDASVFGSNLDGDERESNSFFVEDRFSAEFSSSLSLELNAGARYDDFDTFGSEVSPRVGVALVTSVHKFRAAYGEGFRAPSVGELYFPFSGNRELDPERTRSFEIGYDNSSLPNTAMSVTLFSADFENLIEFDNETYAFRNIGEASSRGIELGATTRLGAFSGTLSYTYLDTEDEATGEELLRRPTHSGSLSAGYAWGPASATLVVAHSGARRDVQNIFPYAHLTNDPYTTADVLLQYASGRFTPYVRVDNLLDEDFEEVYGYASDARRALIGLRYSLK